MGGPTAQEGGNNKEFRGGEGGNKNGQIPLVGRVFSLTT